MIIAFIVSKYTDCVCVCMGGHACTIYIRTNGIANGEAITGYD